MPQTWTCKTEDDTKKAAQEIADSLSYPAVICLYGNLGAGKTAFSRAYIRSLTDNPEETVPSPTYTLVQTYAEDTIWHFDLYRLEAEHDLYDIGWEEALTSKLCLIEWPERLGRLKPQKTVDITIETLVNGDRRITLDT